jgi:F0F1-type ATP synthase assembly protein I
VTKRPPKSAQKQPFAPLSGLGFAYRVGVEFTSGILVGLLMGYAIDKLLNTQPWGLVVMVLLGASAGLLNIFRMLGLWGSSTPEGDLPPKPPEGDIDG